VFWWLGPATFPPVNAGFEFSFFRDLSLLCMGSQDVLHVCLGENWVKKVSEVQDSPKARMGEHGSPSIDTSEHVWFANDQLAVRFIEEIDFDYAATDATAALITAAS
jgi:hypothetical protein